MKTAEEICKKHSFVSDDGEVKSHLNFVVAAMHEYASQFHTADEVREIAKNAHTDGRAGLGFNSELYLTK